MSQLASCKLDLVFIIKDIYQIIHLLIRFISITLLIETLDLYNIDVMLMHQKTGISCEFFSVGESKTIWILKVPHWSNRKHML